MADQTNRAGQNKPTGTAQAGQGTKDHAGKDQSHGKDSDSKGQIFKDQPGNNASNNPGNTSGATQGSERSPSTTCRPDSAGQPRGGSDQDKGGQNRDHGKDAMGQSKTGAAGQGAGAGGAGAAGRPGEG